ncbi:MAG: 4Fe-4S binding protein, partial [Clostridia bacterium]|nr:4Fe-4S binding protein [Clostridia bacterium]
YGEVMTSSTVTVSGGAIKRARNLTLPLGTLLSDAVKHCGGEEASAVIIGGAMNGVKQTELDAPILSGAAILCLSTHYRAPEQFACIRCGRCASSCPMSLSPVSIYNALKKNKEKRAATLRADLCIECGTCAFVCPARLPLLEEIRAMKHRPTEEMPKDVPTTEPEAEQKEVAEDEKSEA